MSLVHKMAAAHEERLCEAFEGRMTRGSGNQPKDPMDGKHTRLGEVFSFAWDGKSTRGKSVGVSREMWEKAVEQARDRRPMLGLCFYDDDRLRSYTDLVVMSMDDAVELREAAVKHEKLMATLRLVAEGVLSPAEAVDKKFFYEEDDETVMMATDLVRLFR